MRSRYWVCKILQSKINKTHDRDRFRRIRQKDIYLTEGDLAGYGLTGEKSAEAILVGEYELRTDTAEDSQTNEGLNIRSSLI